MPSTRPGITFDENGVCAACQSYENRKNVDGRITNYSDIL
jgi:hypothetical protein